MSSHQSFVSNGGDELMVSSDDSHREKRRNPRKKSTRTPAIKVENEGKE